MFENLFNIFKLVSGKRSTGKTYKLLEAASRDTGSCIVCANVADQRALKSIIKENDWTIEVITFAQFVKRDFLNTDIKSFYFDDVDKMFRGIAYPKKIRMMSFNSDNIKIIQPKYEDDED